MNEIEKRISDLRNRICAHEKEIDYARIRIEEAIEEVHKWPDCPNTIVEQGLIISGIQQEIQEIQSKIDDLKENITKLWEIYLMNN